MLVLFYLSELTILPDIMDWPVTPWWSPVLLLFPHWPAPCLEVASLSLSPQVLLLPEHCLWRCPVQQYLQFSTHFCFFWVSLSCLCVLCLMELKSFTSFILSKASFFTHCASIPLAHRSTLSMVTSLMSSNTDTSFKISLIMPLPCNPCKYLS